MTDTIKHALKLLDPAVDDDWTADDLPRMDRLEELLNGASITRAEVNEAAPGFTRKNLILPGFAEMDESLTSDQSGQIETSESAPESAPESAEKTMTSNDDDVADLEKEKLLERKSALEAKRNAQIAVIEKERGKLKAITDELDVIILEETARRSQVSNAQNIKAYQRSQHEARMRAAEKRQLLASLLGEKHAKEVMDKGNPV